MGRRIGFALLGLLAIMTLFAEGLLDHPWISWFSPVDPSILARPKLVLLLMIPVAGFLLAPRVRWVRAVLMITAVSCLTVSALDLVLRMTGIRVENGIPQVSLPQLPWLRRWAPGRSIEGIGYGDLAGLSRDPSLRELRPRRFQTDNRGFRNSHPGTDVDMVILGDSFGAGLSTTQDSVFASLLEARSGLRVYNLSFPNGPQYEYVNLLAEAPFLTFRPHARVVWVLFTGNDLSDAANNHLDPVWWTGLRAARIRYQNYREQSPIRRVILTVFADVLSGPPPPDLVIRRALPDHQPILFESLYQRNVDLSEDAAERHPNFPRIERAMRAMRQFTDQRGLTLTVVLIPAKEEIYRWILEGRERRPTDVEESGFAHAIMDACGRVGILCLSTKPALTEEAHRAFDASGQLVYWRDDTHLNDRGHEIVADFIARRVLGSE